MSIIKGVLKEEYARLIKLFKLYQNKIKQLPKGAISYKKLNKKIYVYLAYKINKKVKFDYLGKKSDPKVQENIKKSKLRNKYIASSKKLKIDIRKLGKILNGNKI